MKVIVLGATGFIGLSVAQALVRAGHEVVGQTRSADKANRLAIEEITPIVGPATDAKTWESHLATAEVVIDSLATSLANTKAVLACLATVESKRHPTSPKITYIYISGSFVHGDNRNEYVSDTSATPSPATFVAWRVSLEQEIIKSTSINGIVIRPSLLYGRSASHLAPFFKAAYDGKVSWPGKSGGRLTTIHADDLADFVLKATEKSAVLGGLIFDASNTATEGVEDFLSKLARVSGTEGYSFYEPTNDFEEGLSGTMLVRHYLGRTLLGWHPVKASLVDGLETWYSSWKASAGIE